MLLISETRLIRLEMLIKKYGSLAKLNEASGYAKTDATLSQIRNKAPHTKTGTPRAMGDPVARRLEKNLGLEAGWMDTPPSYLELHGEHDPRTTVIQLMESMPQSQWATVVRLVDAITQPKNGTSGT